jgi:HJR/Mrr/RecB family endonuclease
MFSYIIFLIVSIQLIKLMDACINTISIASLKHKEKQRMDNGLLVLSHLHYLTPGEFEVWCGEFLKTNGFENIEATKLQADGGKDIICSKDGKKVYVECKKYSSSYLAMYRVNTDIVKKLVGTMLHDGVENGIIITTGLVDKSVHQYIKEIKHLCEIDIIDGYKLENNLFTSSASLSF